MRSTILGLAAVLVLAGGAPAAAQTPEGPALRVRVLAGGSVRQKPTRIAIAEDVRTLAARLTLPRQARLQPWIQAQAFTRPRLVCPETLACNTDGWTALIGVTAPFSADDLEPGVHSHLVAGIGWGFSEQDRFAYLFGGGMTFAVIPRLAPTLEVRWEDFPGIQNVIMVNLGLRIDLF